MEWRNAILTVTLLAGCASQDSQLYSKTRQGLLKNPTNDVQVMDGKIGMFYRHMGKEGNPKIILIHGLAMNSGTWENTIQFLSENYDVYAPDLIGFGYSDKPKNFEYCIPGLGESIKGFMDIKGIQRATLVGNSLGGGVAMYLASHYPERVSALVLENSIGIGIQQLPGLYFLKLPIISSFFKNPNHITRSIEDLTYPRIDMEKSTYNIPYESPDAWVALRNHILECNDEETASELMSSINVPTLIIAGKSDPAIPLKVAQTLHEYINGSELVIYPTGHFPHLEDPLGFNESIDIFLHNLKDERTF